MLPLFLYLNCALYGVFALWSTLAVRTTSQSVGYESLTRSGHSEYLVVYGGLQIGLALAFAYFANTPALHRAGLTFALLLYIPIVVYRWVTLGIYWPVRNVTLAVAALESLLLLATVLLFITQSRPST